MSHQTRKIPLDPEPDEPCLPADWVQKALVRGMDQGLCTEQLRLIDWLLSSSEAEGIPVPFVMGFGRMPNSSVALIWCEERHSAQALLFRVDGHPAVLLCLWRGQHLVVDEETCFPIAMFRRILERVYPGMFRGRAD